VRPDLCLVEDDPIMGESLKERLTLEGFSVEWCKSGAEALEKLQQHNYSAVISDIQLPDIKGNELFSQMISNPQTHMPPTIFITGFGSVESAVELLKLGAVDYLTKPFEPEILIEKLWEVCRSHQRAAMKGETLGVSPAIRRLGSKLSMITRHPEAPVLIVGESGSGKEVVARQLHALDGNDCPFIAVNCAAIPENLIETELFGHEKGAFTGAEKGRRGVFEQADGGVLFLDEIGDMPLLMQAKLLRAIQEKMVTRVGGERLIEVNFRLICATNRDLKKLVDDGSFRMDLYYRINVIQLPVPPLRNRHEDILWLAERFIASYAECHPDQHKRLTVSAREMLLAYHWPGNVRELKHTIERACIMTQTSSIEAVDLSLADCSEHAVAEEVLLKDVSTASQRDCIVRTLEAHGWRMAETAKALGVSRKTLWQKMKKMGIQRS